MKETMETAWRTWSCKISFHLIFEFLFDIKFFLSEIQIKKFKNYITLDMTIAYLLFKS